MDASTLLATNALLSSAAAVVLAVLLRTRKTYAGFGFWTAGIACLALGAAALIPGLLPSSWSTRMLRNGLLLAGHLLILRGMLQFRGIRVGGWLEALVALLFLLPFAMLSIDAGRLSARIVYYCLFTGALSVATVVVTLRRRPPHFGSNDVLLALWLSLFALISLARAAQELADVSTAFESIKSLGSVYALAQILSVQLVTLTLISMNSQRIEWDLRESALQVQQSEQQLRSLGDNLPAGMIFRYEIIDGRRRFDHISGGVEGTLGVKPADVMADAEVLLSKVAPDARARFIEEEARSAALGRDFHTTVRFDLPDGRARWLDIRSRPQQRPDGSRFWEGLALDVTERRRAEDDLRRYKSLVNSSEDAIITKTLQGTITSWNGGAERLFGYPAAEALGKPVEAFVPPDLAGEERGILDIVARGETVRHFETRRLHRSGRQLDLSVAVSPIYDADGRVVAASTIARDITDRIAAREREMRQSRLYHCLSQCNAAVARCDTEAALFDAVCQSTIDTAGMALAWVSLVDEAGALVVHAQAGQPADYPHRLEGALPAGDAQGQGPAGIALQTGQPVWCQAFDTDARTSAWRERVPEVGFGASASLPVQRSGAVVGTLTICAGEPQAFDEETRHLLVDLAANISFALDNLDRENERRQAQQALIAHRQHLEDTVERRTRQLAEVGQRAEAASLAKSAFLANMSHEIRTPLNAMIGMAHLIRREELSPSQTDRLLKLETAAKHLLDVLNTILDLSKIEAGKMTLESVPFQVESTLANVLSILGERARSKHLQLLSEVEPMPQDLVGDPTRIQQALLNFANNAIKFTERGRVLIRASVLEQDEASALLRFEVQDTGIGIEPEVMPRLFGAFEQADRSTTRTAGGTGLGLAITRKLAALMGGDAGTSSVPGTGSTFWFSARVARALAAPAGPPSIAELDVRDALLRRHGGARLLLAEDNLVNAEVAQALLEEVGLQVDLAADGAAAVDMALKDDYRLVLMDMQMPQLDGLDACRAIRQRHSAQSLPIIAMTANAFAEDKALCHSAGMNDFLSKPVEPQVLYAMLLRWLDPPRAALAPH